MKPRISLKCKLQKEKNTTFKIWLDGGLDRRMIFTGRGGGQEDDELKILASLTVRMRHVTASMSKRY
jgi:hypothetical protein